MSANPIELYSLATPNGQKVGVALEEMELPYNAHKINILEGDQFTDKFKSINPNSKIPAIVDPDGPGGKALTVFESGAILLYLAEKSGKFLSQDPVERMECLQWLFFQMGGVGPMFGQFGHFFKYATDKCDHPYPKDRYLNETRRLLGVIEKQLDASGGFLCQSGYSIADMATFPWVMCLDMFYNARDALSLDEFTAVTRWVTTCSSRPKAAAGLEVCSI
ncbi:MAG: glutathione S-transferase N-terminal domain-containing protein [Pseudobacteriovorax sp.]|nr:glutathione S-transferase N-terminal domain-containing protein [Pseudobacteriovorax sp.]